MTEKEIDQLIDRYIHNECSLEEKRMLEAWFDAQANNSHWKWNSLANKIAVEKELKRKIDQALPRSIHRPIFRHPIFRIAASILLVSLISLALYLIPITNQYFGRLAYQTVIVPKGEITNVKLPDGSTVFLNASSVIKYPKSFKGDRRELILVRGEAWFDIAPDKSKPFIVISEDVETRVLGTAFNIRAYPFLENIVVTVERGKVEVRDINNSPDQTVHVLPNEQAIINKQVHTVQKAEVDMQLFVKWKTGGINFENDLLSTVAKLLEEKYKVSIRLSDAEYANKRLTASFEPTDSMNDVLAAISSALGMEFRLEGKTVYLNPK